MVKRIIFISAVIFCLLVINSFVHSIYDLLQKQNLITQTRADLTKKQAENKRLKQQLAQSQGNAFIEQEARDKLFLVKPGEEHVIIPKDGLKKQQAKNVTKDSSHIAEWVQLFFH